MQELMKQISIWGLRILLPLFLVYVLVLLFVFFSQRSLIFPGSAYRGEPYYEVSAPPGTELVRLTTSTGDRIAAVFGPALTLQGKPHPQAASRPTVLYFYGNGDSLKGNLAQLHEIRLLGVNVMIPEYVGFGMSTGTASEAGCYSTADAAYDHLLARRDIDPSKIVAAGWSLGGAVAIDLASRKPVAGLANFSTFTSMGDMAQRLYPVFPARLLLRHRFESERKMVRVTCPVLLGHGKRDTMIPFSMTERLAKAARGPVTVFFLDEAQHNDFWAPTEDRQAYVAFQRFLDRL
jgi:uncharacterized protein